MSSYSQTPAEIFRACISRELGESSELLGNVVKGARSALGNYEGSSGTVDQFENISHALKALEQYELALKRMFPDALGAIFSETDEGDSDKPEKKAALELGELTLMDDNDVTAHVELSRVRQIVKNITEMDVAMLNTYACSAMGLTSVKPERNPFKPENYIRALQQVVDATDVAFELRQIWMQHMGETLGRELSSLYARLIAELVEKDVKPVGYAVTIKQQAPVRSTAHRQDAMAALSNALVNYPASLQHQIQQAVAGQLLLLEQPDAVPQAGGVVNSLPTDVNQLGAVQMREQVDGLLADMANLEMLTSRLRGASINQASSQKNSQTSSPPAHVPELVNTSTDKQAAAPVGAPPQQSAIAAHPVSSTENVAANQHAMETQSALVTLERMFAALAQDASLHPSLQQMIVGFQPSLTGLVQRDASFFSDPRHPARRLLDEVIRRGRAYSGDKQAQLDRFIHLTKELVRYLGNLPVHDLTAFEHVFQLWERAWVKRAPASTSETADRRQELKNQNAIEFRKLTAARHAPDDVLEILTGPWAEVVARAQCDGDKKLVGKFLAVVPLLLWCSQSEVARKDAKRLLSVVDSMKSSIRQGLESIEFPEAGMVRVLRRIDTHRQMLERSAGKSNQTAASVSSAAGQAKQTSADATDAGHAVATREWTAESLDLGQWFDMSVHERSVRTQLTWTSPQRTSFMFKAQDGSTQSLTLRMLTKLAQDGALMRVEPT